jgi:hypothetical protein
LPDLGIVPFGAWRRGGCGIFIVGDILAKLSLPSRRIDLIH